MSDHEAHRERVAAFVLGALGDEERRLAERHLASCERCRDEALSFAPLPGLLGLVDLGDLVDPGPAGPGADAVVARVRGDLGRLRASRRRWRAAAVAVAVAAVVALVGVLAVDLDGGGDGDREVVALTVEPGPAPGASGVTGEVVADERAWGTYVHVSLEGLPRRSTYRLWVVDGAGTWHEAGSWRPTPDGTARLGGSTHLGLGELSSLVVTSDDRGDEILTAT